MTALRFEADYSGMIHFTTAECVVEVEVVEDKVIEVPDNSTTTAAANSTDKADAASSKGDTDKAADDDKSKDGDSKAASGDSAADKEEKEKKSETEAAEDEEKKGEDKEGDKDKAADEGEGIFWGGEHDVCLWSGWWVGAPPQAPRIS